MMAAQLFYRGLFVPWVAMWSDEQPYELRPCRWAGGRRALWQPHRPGSGAALFTEKHIVRGRRALVEGLCNLCGETIEQGAAWINLDGGPTKDDPDWVAIWESPMHVECIDLARQLCPHVKAGRTTFAPYNGVSRIGVMGESGAELNSKSGLSAHPDAFIATSNCLQIPAGEYDRLLEIGR